MSLVENYLDENKTIRKVNITLFVGEPTINWDFAEEMIIKLDEYFSYKSIEY